jgi:hypothetical protein
MSARPRPRPRPLRLLLLLPILATACSGTGPTGDRSPTATEPSASSTLDAPWGLDPAALPLTEKQVEELLDAMPDTLQGLTAVRTGNEVGYGNTGMGELAGSMEVFLRAMDLGGRGDYGTGAPFIQAMADTGGVGSGASQLDPAAPLVFAVGSTPGATTYYSAMWAVPDSRYVFLVQATSEEERLALVEAFKAASSIPG